MGVIGDLQEVAWCLGSDFNSVRISEEKQNCTSLSRTMREFSEFVYDLG